MRKALFILCTMGCIFLDAAPQAVTYSFSGGRFGDNLVAYLHAKWLAQQNHIPVLYKTFPYSSHLMLDEIEVPIEKCDPTITRIYTCNYFPEFKEHDYEMYVTFPIEWKNPEFRKVALEAIAPKKKLELVVPPKNAISIAIHLREGGDCDLGDFTSRAPLKSPPLHFYIDNLLKICAQFEGCPLYCYVFTDALDPIAVTEKIRKATCHINSLLIDCRQEDPREKVLEDFYSQFNFDIMIRPQSNYSIVPSRLHDYAIVCSPVGFTLKDNAIFIDQVELNVDEQLCAFLKLKKITFEASFAPHFPCKADNHPLEKLCKFLYESYQNQPMKDYYIIPRLIHFIWLGSPLPPECAAMVETWKKIHPAWTVKVWTDADVASFGLRNQAAYDLAASYGEKSDVLRYELLYRYGGIYVDTDFECLHPFDNLHKTCSFYTGVINEWLLSGIIGSVPGHPIMKACIENVRVGKGDFDADRIFEDAGPYLFTKMFLASVTLKDTGQVVALPPSFLYPFPATSRHLKDKTQIKDIFVRPESLAIHYWSSAWWPD